MLMFRSINAVPKTWWLWRTLQCIYVLHPYSPSRWYQMLIVELVRSQISKRSIIRHPKAFWSRICQGVVLRWFFSAESESAAWHRLFSILRRENGQNKMAAKALSRALENVMWTTIVHSYWVKFVMGWFSDDFASLNPNLLHDILK